MNENSTILGGLIEWHTDIANDKPNFNNNVIYAYKYKMNERNADICNSIFYSSCDIYFNETNTTLPIAWAYINSSKLLEPILQSILAQEKETLKVSRQMRIEQLEAELKRLKCEVLYAAEI